MTGKEQCDMLKRMREKIAKENGIEGFEYEKCPYEGPCNGTCPACDAEAESLYMALQKAGLDASKLIKQQTSTDPLDLPDIDDVRLMGEVSIEYFDVSDIEIVETSGVIIPEDHEPGRIVDRNPIKSTEHQPILGQMQKVEPPKINDQIPHVLAGKIKAPSDRIPQYHKTKGKLSMSAWEKEQRKQDRATKTPRGLLGLFKKKDSDED
jgi:hypothetical protein